MELLVNTITNRQMFFLLFVTLTAYSGIVIAKEMVQSAGTGSWITILITCLVFALGAMGIVYLNNLFKGQMLYDYAPRLVTKAGAYILALIYILYFLFIVVFLITEVAILLKADFFSRTPLWAIPVIGIPVYCYISYKGITNVARLSEIIGAVFICTALFVHILMITQGQPSRILPLFNAQEISKYLEGFKSSVFPFLGIEILLAVPFVPKKGGKPVRAAFFSVIAIGLFYVLLVESCIIKIGLNDIINYKDALIVAIRDTSPEFFEFLTRLDILYLTIGFAGLFLGISIAMTVMAEYLCRLMKNVSRAVVVTGMGVAVYGLFLLVYGIKGYEEFATGAGTIAGILVSLVIPAGLIIIARVKKSRQKGGH
ncbi:MAG: GerAB/ArcD/ProY family transporter [Christensenellales bacterium]